jgi:hypothetical protein
LIVQAFLRKNLIEKVSLLATNPKDFVLFPFFGKGLEPAPAVSQLLASDGQNKLLRKGVLNII